MYSELYSAWQQEVKNAELQPLPPDFYARTSDYLRRIKEESRLLDKKTTKAVLLEKEMQSVRQIINMTLTVRYIKAIPGVIGSDMKTYGPFMAEDVASLPAENAKILVKQGLAEVVEVS